MSRMFDVIGPDEERYAKTRKHVFFITLLASLCIFSYPHVRDYRDHWHALVAAQRIASYVQAAKTEALLTKKPFEVRFAPPATLERYAVTSCGVSTVRSLVESKDLSQFATGLELLSSEFVHNNLEQGETTTLNRFCYDPINGSSLGVDGVLHGSIYLAVHVMNPNELSSVKMTFFGSNGDIEIE